MSKHALKIGMVFDDSLDRNDGVQQYVKTVGAWLSAQGHEVRYLVGETKMTQWAGGKVYCLARNVHVRFNGNRLSIPGPASKKIIREVLEQEQFDILHVQMPHSPFLSQRIIKLAHPKTAVIGTFHILPAGRLQHIGSRLLSKWYGRTIRRFDQIFSVTNAAQDFAQAVFGLKTNVLPNVVERQKFVVANLKKPTTQKTHIVFLGRLVKRKGAAELIHAFAYALHELGVKNAELTIAGDGPERSSIEKLVAAYHLESCVHMLGFIDEADKPRLLADADVAVFPSLYGESFGIVLIEAMAAGAGVVLGGNNPGYSSVLQPVPEALFDPTDTANFATILQKGLVDEEFGSAVHKKQAELVVLFDIARVGPKLLDYYQTALLKRR